VTFLLFRRFKIFVLFLLFACSYNNYKRALFIVWVHITRIQRKLVQYEGYKRDFFH
jgi:hypothetical protein